MKTYTEHILCTIHLYRHLTVFETIRM